MSKLSEKEAKTAEKEAGTEILFRNVTIVLVGILLYCIPGFLSFRNIAATHGLYFIRAEAWWWCLLGCVAFGVPLSRLRQSNTLTTRSSRARYWESSIQSSKDRNASIG